MHRTPRRAAERGVRSGPHPGPASARPGPRGAGRLSRVGRTLLALVVLGTTSASAERPRAQASAGPNPLAAPALPPLDDHWRARGMAYFDLPLGLRARYEARALHRFGALQDGSSLFSALVDDPNHRATRLLESRFALTRAVARHVELELAWTARSPLSMFDLTRIEDQRVAAMIRFAP